MAKARAKGRLEGKQPKPSLAERKTIHRRYHEPADDASLADLAEEYSVGRSTIHRCEAAFYVRCDRPIPSNSRREFSVGRRVRGLHCVPVT
ncbi:hypothetical protein [Nocardia sp. NPDC059691]|uniref:hypothetical protein n=1 Tax=Nocardia sp. NPDC059691 TaxID=3346908 RepID=UPI00369F2E90